MARTCIAEELPRADHHSDLGGEHPGEPPCVALRSRHPEVEGAVGHRRNHTQRRHHLDQRLEPPPVATTLDIYMFLV